ncbi:MAG: hypothetical protein ACKV0T_05865 [Planctomycetales bacterium]
MTAPAPSGPESLTVACPVCHERFVVGLQDQPQRVACTFCATPVAVVSREQARREHQARQKLPLPVPDEYPIASPQNFSPSEPAPGDPPDDAPPEPDHRLRHAGEPTWQPPQGKSTKPPRSGAPRRAAHSPSPSAADASAADATSDQAIVECPACHERMQVTLADKPGKVECTFCFTEVPVPARVAFVAQKKKGVAPQSPAAVGTYNAEAPAQVLDPQMGVFDRLAEVRIERPDPPPKWTFFSGVFSFPFRREAIFRWGGLSFGFTVVFLLASFLATGAGRTGPSGLGVVGMGFLVAPLLLIALYVSSYAADTILRILESTAYGLDQVQGWCEGWSQGGWREWVPQLLYLQWIAALPSVASCGIGHLAMNAGLPFWPVMLASLVILYPIALLSALEANSLWVPLSWPVVKSLIVVWWGWVMFYLLSTLCLGGCAALLLLGWPAAGWPVLLLCGPLFSASLLIVGRLLGRLAWKIGQRM